MEKWKTEIRLTHKGYEKNEKWKSYCVCADKNFLYTPLRNFLRLLFLIDFSNTFCTNTFLYKSFSDYIFYLAFTKK
jgi:hypothetical protein